MPVEMPWMCQRNRLDLQCPQPQNPRSRAGGRLETPESIAVDFGSPSAAPDGVRASRAEAAPGSLGRTRQSRARKGGEGSGSGAAPPGRGWSPGRRRFEATRGERRRQDRFGGWSAKGGPAEPCPQLHLPPSIGLFFSPLDLFLIPNLISFDILIAGLTSLLESCAA